MSGEYFDCIYNLWTGFVGKATCEAGYLKCDGLSCPMYTQKKDPKPITHYDLLIRKTPEELAEWIADVATNQGGGSCAPGCHDCSKYPEGCKQPWLSWLKSPVEVDNGD